MKRLSTRRVLLALAILATLIIGGAIVIADTERVLKLGELITRGLGAVAFTLNLNPTASLIMLFLFGGGLWLWRRRRVKHEAGRIAKIFKALLVLFLAVNGLNVFVWGAIYGLAWGMNHYLEYQRPGYHKLAVLEHKPRQYELRGDEIYMTVAGRAELLLENVKDVQTVTTGPDGYTVHFRPHKDRENWLPSYCAHPGLPTHVPYGANKPATAPWNFEAIGNYAELSPCGRWGRAGGYLKESDYFAFVRQTDQDITLVVNDVTTRQEISFDIPKEVWDKLLAHLGDETYVTEYGVHYGLAAFMGIKGTDGNVYYYPQIDDQATKGKILLGFSHLVVALDIPEEKILGFEWFTYPNFASDVYGFQTSTNSPLVVAGSSWDQASQLQVVFDLSGESLKIEPLYEKFETYYDLQLFKTPFVEWDRRGVLYLHAYKIIDAMEGHISQSEREQYDSLGGWTDEQIEAKKVELENRLQRTGSFIEVQCMTEANLYCSGLVKGKEYRMIPGRTLEEI